MPTYVYRCTGCNTTVEVQHSIEESLHTCECGWSYVKVFSPTGVIFKGSGFYSTDNGHGDS